MEASINSGSMLKGLCSATQQSNNHTEGGRTFM